MILEVGGNWFELEVHREPSVYTWCEGQKMSDPDGWRLPTIEELAEMHRHKDEVDFGPASYWSQDEYDDDRAMLWSFNSGRQFEHPKCGHFSVWRVRDVEPEKPKEQKTGYYWSADLRIAWNGETIEFSTDDYPEGRRITVDVSIYQANDLIDALSRIRDDYYREKYGKKEADG